MNQRIQSKLKPPTLASLKSMNQSDKLRSPGMVQQVMFGCGVSLEILDEYLERANSWEGRSHASLRGVCDYTGVLPEGSVFISGFYKSSQEIFVTTYPCTERDDGKILPVVYIKPAKMSKLDWKFLKELPFGLIMFSSPKSPQAISLPEQIAGADLDGDDFFVCWDRNIIVAVKSAAQIYKSKDKSPDKILSVIGNVPDELIDTDDELSTREEDGSSRLEVEQIIGHKCIHGHIEVQCSWSNEVVDYQRLSILKNEIPEMLAEYAREKNILNEKGWAWARNKQRESPAVKIMQHRVIGDNVEVKVMYDDGVPNWEPINSFEIDDIGIIVEYISEKEISLTKEWTWLKKSKKKAESNWLHIVQEHLCDIRHMSNNSRFIEALHRAWKNRWADSQSLDSVTLGRAYKLALDLGKHGGRVSLSPSLRDEVVGKTSAYANNFLQFTIDDQPEL